MAAIPYNGFTIYTDPADNPGPGYSWGWINGRDSQSGAGWIPNGLQVSNDAAWAEAAQKAESQKKSGGGVLGTVGGIAGGIIGGPAGAAIGSGLGTLAGGGSPTDALVGAGLGYAGGTLFGGGSSVADGVANTLNGGESSWGVNARPDVVGSDWSAGLPSAGGSNAGLSAVPGSGVTPAMDPELTPGVKPFVQPPPLPGPAPVIDRVPLSTALNTVASGVKSALSTAKDNSGALTAASLLAGSKASGTPLNGTQPYDPSADLRQQEEQRQARINSGNAAVNSAFAGFDDPYYQGVSKAYTDYYTPLLSEQYTEAKRKLPLAYARTDNSEYARTLGNLERDYQRQLVDVNQKAIDAANQQRSTIEANRGDLLGQVSAGAGIDTAASSAAARAKALLQPPSFSPIADVFQKYTSNAANAVLLNQGSGYQQQAPVLFGVGGGMGSSRNVK